VTEPGTPHTEGPADGKTVALDGNLLLMFGVTLMVVMGVSSIAPAFPVIIRELDVSVVKVGLLISFFTIPGALFAPVAGILADRFGRKRLLVPALFLFGVSGSACALAPNFPVILALRFLQGLGATTMGTLNVTILGDIYTGDRRTTVLGYNISVLSVGTALYPVLGGALAMLGWRFPFLLSVVAIPLGVLVALFLKNPEPENTKDLAGYFDDVLITLKKRRTAGLFTVGVLSFFVFYGSYITFFPLLLSGSFGASTLTIGLIMSVPSVTTALTSLGVGALVERVSGRSVLAVGYLFFAASMLLIPLVGVLWGTVAPTVLLGVGMGLTIPCIQSLLTAMAPLGHRAAFLSFNSMVLRLGQTLGPAAMGLVMTASSLDFVFLAGCGISMAMSLIAWTTLGDTGGRP